MLQKLNGGTTAVCALILNKKLYVAWVGDSMASLVAGDSVAQLVNPHRPARKVSSLGSSFPIIFNRPGVMGQLVINAVRFLCHTFNCLVLKSLSLSLDKLALGILISQFAIFSNKNKLNGSNALTTTAKI